jgi:probable phosphoglycerate mutase
VAGAYVEVHGCKPEYLWRPLGHTTNNISEWEALALGLEYALLKGVSVAMVRGDSKLVINQASGSWKVKHPNMKPLKARVDVLLKHFKAVSFEWVPREQNQRADYASRRYGTRL